MYFPYIRGKQFDLIALKETVGLMARDRSKISPIIEPVKNSSTLKSTLEELANNDISFNIVVNPTVGDLTNSQEEIIQILSQYLNDYSNYQIAVIIDDGYGDISYLQAIQDLNLEFNGFSLIHNCVVANPSDLIGTHEPVNVITNNVVNFQKTNRRYERNFKTATVVSLEDFFHSQSKNADYLQVEDSSFSEEHLFFARDGFKGFADYLTIGEAYSETGFLPYAVAIHLSYVDTEGKIRVRHFVSDSNDDSSDVGGKFAEALNKLITWIDENRVSSIAISKFRELYDTGHFPGLGSIKKLSIMNHIELVLGLI